MSPQRIQLRRTKGWRKPAGAVVVSRPSRWGNPFRVGDPVLSLCSGATAVITPELAADMFRVALVSGRMAVHSGRAITVEEVRHQLAGKDLACWCPPGQVCHADVLLELANRESGRPVVCPP